ncbi:carboxymuconolactone decarboxylase family protein [Planotetraspora sp. GP83]|uniref:carboxymuconolactone decarboxylase family protein n=1 Tax=Planotetraspora sp. GP83 TaxID=3156264 RepID=UPI003512EDA2
MARVPYPEMPEHLLAAFPMDKPLNVVRMLAHAEGVWASYLKTGSALLTRIALPPRLRELVILRVAHLQVAPYELAQHEPLARAYGVTDEELAALEIGAKLADGAFDDIELAALELVTEMITEKDAADRTFDRAYAALGDRGTVELLLLAVQYAGLALFLNTLRVDVDVDTRPTLPHLDR